MPDVQVLTPKQQGIIPIAAFTANGDQALLKTALQAGLEAGLTINEIKEVLAGLGLHLGMEVPDWPPEDIEGLAKKYDDHL